MLRRAVVFLPSKIRLQNRMAELLGSGETGFGQRARGSELIHAPHGSALRGLRGASGACFPRWPKTDGSTLLHERDGAHIRPARRGSRQDLGRTPPIGSRTSIHFDSRSGATTAPDARFPMLENNRIRNPEPAAE